MPLPRGCVGSFIWRFGEDLEAGIRVHINFLMETITKCGVGGSDMVIVDVLLITKNMPLDVRVNNLSPEITKCINRELNPKRV